MDDSNPLAGLGVPVASGPASPPQQQPANPLEHLAVVPGQSPSPQSQSSAPSQPEPPRTGLGKDGAPLFSSEEWESQPFTRALGSVAPFFTEPLAKTFTGLAPSEYIEHYAKKLQPQTNEEWSGMFGPTRGSYADLARLVGKFADFAETPEAMAHSVLAIMTGGASVPAQAAYFAAQSGSQLGTATRAYLQHPSPENLQKMMETAGMTLLMSAGMGKGGPGLKEGVEGAKAANPALAKSPGEVIGDTASAAGEFTRQRMNETGEALTPPAEAAKAATASTLRGAAESNIERVLDSTTKKLKQISSDKVVPEILDRGIVANSRKDLSRIAAQGVIEHGAEVNQAIQNAMDDGVTHEVKPILDQLEGLKDEYRLRKGETGEVTAERQQAIGQIDEVADTLRKYGDQISPQDLANVRRFFDDEVAKQKSAFLVDETKGFNAQAKESASNVLRDTLNKEVPDLARANRDFSFYKNLQTVIDATIQRRASQSRIVGQVGRLVRGGGAGGAVGTAIAGPVGGVVGAAVGGAGELLHESTLYRTRAAQAQNFWANQMTPPEELELTPPPGRAPAPPELRQGEIFTPYERVPMARAQQAAGGTQEIPAAAPVQVTPEGVAGVALTPPVGAVGRLPNIGVTTLEGVPMEPNFTPPIPSPPVMGGVAGSAPTGPFGEGEGYPSEPQPHLAPVQTLTDAQGRPVLGMDGKPIRISLRYGGEVRGVPGEYPPYTATYVGEEPEPRGATVTAQPNRQLTKGTPELPPRPEEPGEEPAAPAAPVAVAPPTPPVAPAKTAEEKKPTPAEEKGGTLSKGGQDGSTQQTAKGTEPRRSVPEPRKPSSPVVRGAETKVRVPGQSKAYDGHYEVWELSDLHASHRGDTFAENPDYHYQNDRDYNNPVNREKVVSGAAPGVFEPSYLITDNPDATNGPPVVEEQGNALGGNGRKMIMDRVYSGNPQGAAAYRTLLADRAERFGIDPGKVGEMKQPVLVRVVDRAGIPDEAAARGAITEFNRTGTAALTPQEQSVADSKMVPPEALEHISNKLNDLGPEATIADLLRSSVGEVVDKLIESGVIPKQERAAYISKEGTVTEAGKQRIKGLVLGRFFDDALSLEAAPPSLLQKLERIAAPVSSSSSVAGWDLTPAVRESIRVLQDASAHGIDNIQDLVSQRGLFGQRVYSPEAIALAERLKSTNQKSLEKMARSYAKDASEAAGKQDRLLGAPVTQEQAFRESFGSTSPGPTNPDLAKILGGKKPKL